MAAMLRAFKAIRPSLGFSVDEPPKTSSYTAELFATVREDGRVGYLTRLVLGGRDILEASFKLDLLFEDPWLSEYTITIQKFPRDMDLRRGLLSSAWQNLVDWVANRDATVQNATGDEVSAAVFLKKMKDAEDGPEAAATRWAVVLNDSARLCLQLQGMHTTAASLNSKPSLKRYHFVPGRFAQVD